MGGRVIVAQAVIVACVPEYVGGRVTVAQSVVVTCVPEYVGGWVTVAQAGVVAEADQLGGGARAGDGGQETRRLAELALTGVVGKQLECLAFGTLHTLHGHWKELVHSY